MASTGSRVCGSEQVGDTRVDEYEQKRIFGAFSGRWLTEETSSQLLYYWH